MRTTDLFICYYIYVCLHMCAYVSVLVRRCFGGWGCIQNGVHAFYNRLRPYDVESTTSHPNREVKLRTASIVLWWGTTREVLVL